MEEDLEYRKKCQFMCQMKSHLPGLVIMWETVEKDLLA